MKFANSICKSLLAWALLGIALVNVGCAVTGGVTEVEPCVEIPFLDGAEGACTNTVTHKSYLVNADDWAKERATMIMLRARDWTKIKIDWLKACRLNIAAGDKCAVMVDSVDRAIKALNSIAEKVLKP